MIGLAFLPLNIFRKCVDPQESRIPAFMVAVLLQNLVVRRRTGACILQKHHVVYCGGRGLQGDVIPADRDNQHILLGDILADEFVLRQQSIPTL